MKIFIITIDDVYESTGYRHAPIVRYSKNEAEKTVASLKRSAKETYKEQYNGCDGDKLSFSLFPVGYWSHFHYDVYTNEVEVDITRPKSISKKARKKTKGDVFQETLHAWCEAQEKAHADAKEILSKGPVLLAPYLFGQGKYFIISQELALYPVKAFIKEGEIYVSATLRKDEPHNDEYILDWDDLSHDIPTINDFMSALYESAGEAEHEE